MHKKLSRSPPQACTKNCFLFLTSFVRTFHNYGIQLCVNYFPPICEFPGFRRVASGRSGPQPPRPKPAGDGCRRGAMTPRSPSTRGAVGGRRRRRRRRTRGEQEGGEGGGRPEETAEKKGRERRAGRRRPSGARRHRQALSERGGGRRGGGREGGGEGEGGGRGAIPLLGMICF